MTIKEGSGLEGKDLKNIGYDKVSVTSQTQDQPVINISNCKGIMITNCYQPEQIRLFVNEDEKCDGIILMNNILTGTASLTGSKGKNIVSRNNLTKVEEGIKSN